MPAPFSTHVQQHPLPALYLYPLNDSFIPKHIHLPQGQRIKIGRQTNAKTAPGERNGFFDSKVLSRQHAEVWEESGKIYIKDVKSSNGTFINGERLSAEGAESEPFELKTSDIVEFGIDIVGEDNKTIVHHKVAARVVCVLTEQEAQLAARVESHQNPPSLSSIPSQPGSSNGTAFNFAGTQNAAGPARRPAIQQQTLGGMGGMGANMRVPGKSGITFDHILSRLQGELQKSRETGAELHSLTGAMNEIHETLGGNLPQSLPPYPQSLPPVLPPQQLHPAESDPNSTSSATNSALSELQAQLQETQVSLASHVDKIRSLDSILVEHEVIKREVSSLRELLEEEKHELELIRGRRRAGPHRQLLPEDEDTALLSDEDDDSQSIATVTAHELERVEEEDEEQLAAEEEQGHRRDELTRPRTPEPTGLGMDDEDDKARSRSRSPSPPLPTAQAAPPSSEDINLRLLALSSQLESALELSRSLQAQHATAQNTISCLEAKVNSLESLVQTSQVQAQSQVAEATQERASLTTLVNEWKKGVEGQWGGVQEEWAQERVRLARARDEWELRVNAVEKGLEGTIAKVDAGLTALEQQRLPALQHNQNGSARVGLVTPPSPRSLSSDSDSGGGKSRRKKRPAARGRSRSKDGSTSSSEAANADGDGGSSTASVAAGCLPPNPNPRPRSRWLPEGDSDSDSHVPGRHRRVEGGDKKALPSSSYPIIPDPSVRKFSSGSSVILISEEDAEQMHKAGLSVGPLNPGIYYAQYSQTQMVSTAVGVLVLAAAAATVAWRVKE
ncbi:hypothetical protein BC827DRAFT_1183018 [Russula dissimulans]|nr:hypothetical protein BC827DRAFT_1183018 [Russula dissimulans]